MNDYPDIRLVLVNRAAVVRSEEKVFETFSEVEPIKRPLSTDWGNRGTTLALSGSPEYR